MLRGRAGELYGFLALFTKPYVKTKALLKHSKSPRVRQIGSTLILLPKSK